MTPYCWDVVLLGWMIVWLGIRIGSNGWSPLKWLGSTWKQRLTEVLSWPNTAQPAFIKVSAPGLSANNTDWMGLFFYILFIFPSLWSFFSPIKWNVEPPWIADVLPTHVAVSAAHEPMKCPRHTVHTKLNNQEQVLTSLPNVHEGNYSDHGLIIELWVLIRVKTYQHLSTIHVLIPWGTWKLAFSSRRDTRLHCSPLA